ncbi:hypothetical protein DFH06DRAFT_1149389 [Mycena polygramma]|nr:hypothetical protein DFH06DRAFT_1149389 [Mycena polygramma]
MTASCMVPGHSHIAVNSITLLPGYNEVVVGQEVPGVPGGRYEWECWAKRSANVPLGNSTANNTKAENSAVIASNLPPNYLDLVSFVSITRLSGAIKCHLGTQAGIYIVLNAYEIISMSYPATGLAVTVTPRRELRTEGPARNTKWWWIMENEKVNGRGMTYFMEQMEPWSGPMEVAACPRARVKPPIQGGAKGGGISLIWEPEYKVSVNARTSTAYKQLHDEREDTHTHTVKVRPQEQPLPSRQIRSTVIFLLRKCHSARGSVDDAKTMRQMVREDHTRGKTIGPGMEEMDQGDVGGKEESCLILL